MRRSLVGIVLTITAVLQITSPTLASGPFDKLLDDVKKTTGDVLETGLRVTTAPARTIINAGRAASGSMNSSQIYQPFRRLGNSASRTTDHVTRYATAPQDVLLEAAAKLANESGSDEVRFIVDIGTLQHRISNELFRSTGGAVSGSLRGQNPLQVTAAPLAAAIRAARNQHAPRAQPLPEDVKDGLRPYLPSHVLNRAQYAVGTVEITLPNFIGKGHKFFDQHKAVVVDDIIVFPTSPPSFDESPYWWAHEVLHVQQYHDMGVEMFAYEYIRHAGASIERPAEAFGDRVSTALNGEKEGHVHRSHSGFAQLGAQTQQPVVVHQEFGHGEPARALQPAPELYVAQCVFPDDPPGIARMVTNTGKIIAVETFTGRYLHIGWAEAPLMPNVSWTYRTRDRQWAVMHDGAITMRQDEMTQVWDQWSQQWVQRPTGRWRWTKIGQVIKLQ
ncbi:MAG: hypothetical protein NCW75_05740 [Phycisphaera sp.]|nr:MAG: hypothetical protein NCW75_05740 [Phycisphaera sp.]